MDKKIAGLIGAMSTLASLGGAQAAVTAPARDVLAAASYDDLLQPVPNAVALLAAHDAALAGATSSGDEGAMIEKAQFHHHHHHHRFLRHHHHHRFFRHHHHHHRFFRRDDRF